MKCTISRNLSTGICFQNLIDVTAAKYGRIDCLINNAGVRKASVVDIHLNSLPKTWSVRPEILLRNFSQRLVNVRFKHVSISEVCLDTVSGSVIHQGFRERNKHRCCNALTHPLKNI